MLKDCCFLSDQLLLSLLDQIWIQTVFEPYKKILGLCLEREIQRCHLSNDSLSDLITKRSSLLKLYKLMKTYEGNQCLKSQYALLVNPKYKFD